MFLLNRTRFLGVSAAALMVGGGGGPVPTLSLDFTTLTPATMATAGVTFSRASLATQYDSTGKLTYCPNNLAIQSQTLDNVAWNQSNATIGANATTAPDGTTTADKLQEDTTNGVHNNSLSSNITTVSGQSYILSIYAKAAERAYVAVYDPSLGVGKFFDLSGAGAVLGDLIGTPTSASIQSVGSGWYRCSIKIVANGVTGINSYTSTNGSTFSYAGTTGSGVYLWGAQVEAVTYETTPRAYNPTTSSVYYGPRFDYDPATLAAKGLLIEEARTNLFLGSEAFDDASKWTKQASAITANASTSPAGTSTSDKIEEDNTTGVHQVYQSFIATAAAYTASVFVKAAERTWAYIRLDDGGGDRGAYINLSTGAVGTVENVDTTVKVTNSGNGWWRVALTRTLVVGSSYIVIAPTTGDGVKSFLGTTSSGIYAWGAQVELGSFATSYIPTTSASATRAIDSVGMTSTGFSSWYNATEGTFIETLQRISTATGGRLLSVIDGGLSRSIDLFPSTSDLTAYSDNTGHGGGGLIAVSTGGMGAALAKVAAAYKANDYGYSLNGAAVVADTSVTLSVTPDRLAIGGYGIGGNALNGWVSKLDYYNTRLANATLQSLTT